MAQRRRIKVTGWLDVTLLDERFVDLKHATGLSEDGFNSFLPGGVNEDLISSSSLDDLDFTLEPERSEEESDEPHRPKTGRPSGEGRTRMKARKVQQGDVYTDEADAPWTVREAIHNKKGSHLRLSAGRTDSGRWVTIPSDQMLDIYRPVTKN